MLLYFLYILHFATSYSVTVTLVLSILHRFGDIADFWRSWATLFHPNFGGVSVAPDRPCSGWARA